MLKKLIEFFLILFKSNDDEYFVEVDYNDDGNHIIYIDPDEGQNNESNTYIMNNYSNITVHPDAGHASSTPGKRSPYSGFGTMPALDFYEYQFNRDVVRRIEAKLRALGFNVNIITPEVDVDVALSTRYKRANQYKQSHPSQQHIFVSVHANAFGDGKSWNNACGWSCYTTKGQNNSDRLADCLYDAAEQILPKYGMKIRTEGSDGDRDYEENFTVISGANMPAILTENMFYTNINDTKFLLSEEGKDRIADIHVEGIKKFVA